MEDPRIQELPHNSRRHFQTRLLASGRSTSNNDVNKTLNYFHVYPLRCSIWKILVSRNFRTIHADISRLVFSNQDDPHQAMMSTKNTKLFPCISSALFHMEDPPGLSDFQRFEAPLRALESSIALLFGLAYMPHSTPSRSQTWRHDSRTYVYSVTIRYDTIQLF